MNMVYVYDSGLIVAFGAAIDQNCRKANTDGAFAIYPMYSGLFSGGDCALCGADLIAAGGCLGQPDPTVLVV